MQTETTKKPMKLQTETMKKPMCWLLLEFRAIYFEHYVEGTLGERV